MATVPMKTAHVQVVCRECGTAYRTQVRGGNTRCREASCRASRYVRVDQEWEGPVPAALAGAASRAARVAGRLPVWCACACGHEWQSRAEDRMPIRCPACRASLRVPWRTGANTGPTPRGYVPAPAPAPRSTPYRRARPVDLEPEEWEEDPEEEVPGGSLADALRSLSGMFRVPTLPTLAPVRPVPAPMAASRSAQAGIGFSSRPVTAPRPSTPRRPAPAPITPAAQARNEERDRKRRDNVCSLVRSLSGPLQVWYDTPAGRCEVLDTGLPRERQRCRGMASRAVMFVGPFAGEVEAYSCPAHAEPLAALANSAPGIFAQVVSRDV